MCICFLSFHRVISSCVFCGSMRFEERRRDEREPDSNLFKHWPGKTDKRRGREITVTFFLYSHPFLVVVSRSLKSFPLISFLLSDCLIMPFSKYLKVSFSILHTISFRVLVIQYTCCVSFKEISMRLTFVSHVHLDLSFLMWVRYEIRYRHNSLLIHYTLP